MKRGVKNWPFVALALLVLAGFLLRLRQYGFSLFGDELSTFWIVRDRGLGETLDLVAGDAEITPPLYFVLAWLSARLGDSPELIRLPALIAGTALIPAIGLLGRRMFGWPAGLIAAGLVAISPSMIYFAGTGRAYPVMLFFLACSLLALLSAARSGSRLMWAAFAAASVLAMYSHYTAAFVLAAEFAWLLWAFPHRRRAALISASAAVLAFLPWLGSMIADLNSPTIDLLEALQGDGLDSKRLALEQWALGHPLFPPAGLPGRPAIALVAAGSIVAAGRRVFLAARDRDSAGLSEILDSHRMAILAVAVACATPLGEGALNLLGSDLFSSRNLVASWPGLALAGGGLLASIGPVWGGICGLAVIAGIGVGTVKAVDPGRSDPGYEKAAAEVTAQAGSGDVAIDVLAPAVSPAPATPLGLYLDERIQRFTVNHPEGPPPFLAFSPPKPAPGARIGEALESAEDAVFIVGPGTTVKEGSSGSPGFADGDLTLPAGWQVDSTESIPGRAGLILTTVSRIGD